MARTHKAWHGWRLREVVIPTDDGARMARIPASWDDQAAMALLDLVPIGRADLAALAEAWLQRLPAELGDWARGALMARRAAPEAPAWLGHPADAEPGGYVLNLAAFHEPGFGLDAKALRDAAHRAAACARILDPADVARLRLTDLDGLLAADGLAYDSDEGRAEARRICDMLASHSHALCAGPADMIDGLLGSEAGGIAPRFSWVTTASDGRPRLSRAASGRLAAQGLSAEAALAEMLEGANPLPLAGAAAHAAMRAALAPVVRMAETHASLPQVLPSRPGGFSRKVTLGGHKLVVRTGESETGALLDVSLALPREAPSVRALADVVAQVASLALQHGTPLPELLDVLAGTRFGPAGAVEGDPHVARASSPLDYLARCLAAAYCPAAILPEPEEPEAPRLPLELPVLRLVG